MFCSKCGAENKDRAKFCGKCGAALNGGLEFKSSIDMCDEEERGKKHNGKKKLMIGVCITLIAGVCIIVGLFMGKDKDVELVGNTNTNIANGALIAQDGEWIYYALDNGISVDDGYTFSGQDLVKSKSDGSELEYLTTKNDSSIYSIFVVDEWVYFVKDTYGIYRIKTDGKNEEKISDGNEIFGILGDEIYYLATDDSTLNDELREIGYSNLICRMGMKGQNSEVVYQCSGTNSYIHSPQMDDENIYFMEATDSDGWDEKNESIKKISRYGDNVVTLQTCGEQEDFGYGFCVVGDNVYYCKYMEKESETFNQYTKQNPDIKENGWGYVISAMNASGEENEDLYVTAWFDCFLAIGGDIYIKDTNWAAEIEEDSLVKVSLDEKEIERMNFDEYVGYIFELQYVGDWIYYYDGDNLYRLKFGDANPQLVAEGAAIDESGEEDYDGDYEETEEDDADYSFAADELLGKWENTNDDDDLEYLEFLSDGTLLFQGVDSLNWDDDVTEEGSYWIEDDILYMLEPGEDTEDATPMYYEVTDGTYLELWDNNNIDLSFSRVD